MARKKLKTRLSWILLGTTSILLFIGAVMVLNASSVMAFSNKGDSCYYLKRQVISILIGLLGMVVFACLDYRFLRKFSSAFICLSVILLILIFVPGIGQEVGGARRWISVGGYSFQPSEFVKFAVVLYAADILAKRCGKLKKIKDLFVPFLGVMGLIVALLFMQPHLGAILIICFSVFFLMFLNEVKLRHLASLGLVGLFLVGVSIMFEPYRLRRFFAFLNPWGDPKDTGFHIIQSLLAFGSGGLTGTGLGMSRQKFLYLPEAHTDFIFAIIGEEFGLLGTLTVVFLFLVLIFTGLTISFKSNNNFGKLLGCGMVCLIATQALINMGGVTGILPITGITLPFLSYGGSSLLVNLCGIGVLLNIANSSKKKRSILRS
ncbi:putative lipid II flippase FtsW [Candidatus Oleimmundimicrobium sp.]|uniref:putative lipid II flippase FtsW n=1 Tax=Candidatus Oleimmundimicrobium sp. TaxID=3060597 RepID=UPI00271EE490|nr:putative lipid II flippase FtsW [Candidatus Oleimmundimicrobium sp.]MDO8885508.1 putative lipid II flippase FtsW [Candidatus Oleimmundimicrobium sp.]